MNKGGDFKRIFSVYALTVFTQDTVLSKQPVGRVCQVFFLFLCELPKSLLGNNFPKVKNNLVTTLRSWIAGQL